jgi:hypothetical protein
VGDFVFVFHGAPPSGCNSDYHAAVTVKPAGSTISLRIKSPGWGGFFIGPRVAPCRLPLVKL